MRHLAKRVAACMWQSVDNRSGSIAVEAGFALALLLLMLLPLIDFGGYIGMRLELKQALRAGGQSALDDYADAATIQQVIEDAASFKSGTVTVSFQSPATYCLCQDGTAGTCVGDPGFTVCSDGVPAGRFMTIDASATYDPFFPFLAWFEPNMTVTERLTLRVE